MNLNYIRNDLIFFGQRVGLLKQIVVSKLILGQKDLMLGYFWWVLEPLLWTLVYWILVNKIFQRGGENYHLFVLCGIIPFRAFILSFTQSLNAISQNISLISQLNFPRLYLVFANVIVNHIKLLFGFLVITVFILFGGGEVNHTFVFIIVPFLLQVLLLFGLSMFLSIWGIYYQDISFLTQFIGRALLFASPILYSLERIPEKYQSLVIIANPLAPLILSYRDILLMNRFPDSRYLYILCIEAFLIAIAGFFYFSKHEKRIIKYL
jgi:ABC-type polysaccharide/polyol phosphate export permease